MTGPPNKVERPLFSRFNIITGLIVLVGLWLSYLRFSGGLAAVTNLDHNNPWGVWIGFDLLCGVALAAGGYTGYAIRSDGSLAAWGNDGDGQVSGLDTIIYKVDEYPRTPYLNAPCPNCN